MSTGIVARETSTETRTHLLYTQNLSDGLSVVNKHDTLTYKDGRRFSLHGQMLPPAWLRQEKCRRKMQGKSGKRVDGDRSRFGKSFVNVLVM